MWKIGSEFLKGEDGAITVDWVVLTAAIVGLGVGVIASVQVATTSQSSSVGNAVASQSSLLPD